MNAEKVNRRGRDRLLRVVTTAAPRIVRRRNICKGRDSI
jgi:hypothetical protein